MNDNPPIIRFTEQDVKLFSEASGDRNPLHVSAEYARRTAYGQQVVFGALGALACLAQIDLQNSTVTRLTADFRRPIFIGVDYQIKTAGAAESRSVRLFDGSVPVLTLSVASSLKPDEHRKQEYPAGFFERPAPAEWKPEALQAGTNISGRYRANCSLLSQLCRQWNVTAHPFAAESLLWASYLVGMELPGRNALFFSLALHFHEAPKSSDPFAFSATVLRLRAPIGQLRIGVSVLSEGEQLASGHVVSFIRPEIEAADLSTIQQSGTLSGKVALVIGASRGLGAAITGVLAMQGARVVAVSRSREAGWTGQYPPEVAEQIRFEQGDASDLEWLAGLRRRVAGDYGRLDFLICSAFPPIPALRLERAAYSRIAAYLNQATGLVLAPLCAFLDLLNTSGGCAVLISSVAAETPVREWPHYVAAKKAVEGFVSVAPLQYPHTRALLVRPQRLLTEMTNTPMGRQNAMPPSQMAAQIAQKLKDPPPAGTTEILSDTAFSAARPQDLSEVYAR